MSYLRTVASAKAAVRQQPLLCHRHRHHQPPPLHRIVARSIASTSQLGRPQTKQSSTTSSSKDDDTSRAPGLADDPWAIPMQHPGTIPEDIPRVLNANPNTSHPEGRAEDEATETMRARLVYQSRKRGILETDLLLSTFIDSGKLKSMTREEMQEYDRLLTLPDWTIYYYAIGKKQPPEDSEWSRSKVLAELSKHAANEGKVMRRMPAVTAYGVEGVSAKRQ